MCSEALNIKVPLIKKRGNFTLRHLSKFNQNITRPKDVLVQTQKFLQGTVNTCTIDTDTASHPSDEATE